MTSEPHDRLIRVYPGEPDVNGVWDWTHDQGCVDGDSVDCQRRQRILRDTLAEARLQERERLREAIDDLPGIWVPELEAWCVTRGDIGAVLSDPPAEDPTP